MNEHHTQLPYFNYCFFFHWLNENQFANWMDDGDNFICTNVWVYRNSQDKQALIEC